MNQVNTLVVGIGSPHGDDQLGWLVANGLAEIAEQERIVIRLAKSPVDLLDWIEGVQHLLIVDACRGSGSAGDIQRWAWPSPQLSEIKLSGTHDLSLPVVLALAERLGRLPGNVAIWAIEAANARAGETVSVKAMEAVSEVVQRVACELNFPNPSLAN